MLTLFGPGKKRCDAVARRNFLRAGALAFGGTLTLPQLLCLRAAKLQAAGADPVLPRGLSKSVIMIYLDGGPPHLDMYDMKPEAPSEIRGEFRPIKTTIPGIDICELMPRQARIMDRLTIVRGVTGFVDQHSADIVMSGFPKSARRPAFGSIVSYLRGNTNGLPPYVSMTNRIQDEQPHYTGVASSPFVPWGQGLADLSVPPQITVDRFLDRQNLLGQLDTFRRDLDHGGALEGADSFTQLALDIVTSTRAHEAFDVDKEPTVIRDRYGTDNESLNFLRARRLVEAGVPVVTLSIGGWDAHGIGQGGAIFPMLRNFLPRTDQAISALVTDIYERGLDEDVAVVMWGEFGRSPRVNSRAGRDHWPAAGAALIAGGGFRTGQVIGATDHHASQPEGGPRVTPSNILSTLYGHLGIDPETTIEDRQGRPMYLLEDREPVRELL